MTNFRALLLKISDELTSENLSSMRFVCRDVIPAGRLEHFRRPIDMFVEFERLDRLSEKNRDFLASILVQIGRPDLRNLLLEITDSTGNVQQVPKGVRNPQFVQTLVTQHLLDEISNHITVYWKVLGRKLGLKENIIESIDVDY